MSEVETVRLRVRVRGLGLLDGEEGRMARARKFRTWAERQLQLVLP